MKTNKHAIALALGSLCAIGATPAHAVKVAGDLLEVYGNLYPQEQRSKFTSGTVGTNVDVGQIVTGTTSPTRNYTAAQGAAKNSITKFSWVQSYIGFKGKKKVGSTTVGYDLQAVVTPDTTEDSLFPRTRDAFIFVEGDNWGRFQAGAMDTPYKAMGDRYRMLGISSSNFVSTSNVLSTPGWKNSSTILSFHTRTANQLQYISPRLAGVEAAIGYSNNPNNVVAAGTSQGQRLLAYGANWTHGPFYVSAQREEHRNYMPYSAGKLGSAATTVAQPGGGSVTTIPAVAAGALANATGKSDDHAMRISLGYEQFGARVGFDISRLYYSEDNAGVANKFHSYEITTYQLSAEYDITSTITVAAGYAHGAKGSCELSGGAACSTSGLGGNMFNIGGMYKLDRGLSVFAIANQYRNGAGAQYGSPSGVTAGGKTTNMAVGLQLRF